MRTEIDVLVKGRNVRLTDNHNTHSSLPAQPKAVSYRKRSSKNL